MFQYWTDDTRAARVFSFHLVWLFYEAVQGGADTNELFRAVRQIRVGNSADWHDAFYDLGDRLKALADEADENGHDVTAGQAYLRAFTYLPFRRAGAGWNRRPQAAHVSTRHRLLLPGHRPHRARL